MTRLSRLHASTPPRGFTLIEIMVALVLGAIVVLATHSAFGSALDLTARLEQERVAHEEAMAGREFLTRAFAGIDLTSPRIVGFQGERGAVRFTTRDTAGQSRDVRIHAAGGWLVATSDGQARRLLPADAVALDYLFALGADAPWMTGWQSPVSAPVAVRIRLAHDSVSTVDTLLFVIGPRG